MKRDAIANRAEADFAGRITRQGKTWIHQPRRFRLPGSKGTYTPDFYVIEDRCFYEIVGTRQAYSYQRLKIAAFRSTYPKLRLRLVNIGAWQGNGPLGPRCVQPKPAHQNQRWTVTGGDGLHRLLRDASMFEARDVVQAAIGAGLHQLSELAIGAGLTSYVLRSAILATDLKQRHADHLVRAFFCLAFAEKPHAAA